MTAPVRAATERATPEDSAPAPVPRAERSLSLDLLRALAIFGIVVANVRDFTWVVPAAAAGGRVEDVYPAALDVGVVVATRAFVLGKFNALFSFLFGLGFTLQTARIERAGRPARSVYLRRLGALLGFGLLHFVFLWAGDILIVYALVGLVLLATRRLSDGALLALSVASMVLAAMVPWLDSVLTSDAARALATASRAAEAQEAQAVFAHGSFAEVTSWRARTLVNMYAHALAPNGIARIGLEVVGTALLGAIAGRRGVLVTPGASGRRFRRGVLVVGAVGLVLAAAWTIARATPSLAPYGVELAVLYDLQRPVLMLAYVGMALLLLERPRFRRALAVLAPVGRMPLTSYLGQSAIMTTVFYGYGAGCYAKLGPAEGFLVGCAIFAGQAVVSAAWLRRFEAGPVEWLWRRLTYGRAPAS
jgi:uncharacterized protein